MYVAGRGYTKSLEECDQSNAVLELVALAKLRNFAWDGSGFLDKPKFQPVLTVWHYDSIINILYVIYYIKT